MVLRIGDGFRCMVIKDCAINETLRTREAARVGKLFHSAPGRRDEFG